MSDETGRHGAALDRVIASRARLSRLLLPAPPDAAASAAAASAGWATPRRWRAQWRLWTRGSLAPLRLAVEQGLGGWWRRHPWRDTATVVGEVAAANVRPLIRRHPLVAIGLGAAAGATLAYAQPWRWRAVRVHATHGTRQAFSWLVGQLSQPAIQLLLSGLLLSAVPKPASRPVPQPDA